MISIVFDYICIMLNLAFVQACIVHVFRHVCIHACMNAECVYSGTVRCRYGAVNFLTMIHKRQLMGLPLGWGMGVFPLNAWRGSGVIVASKRRHFDVITSKWRRLDAVGTSLLRGVSAGFCGSSIWLTFSFNFVVINAISDNIGLRYGDAQLYMNSCSTTSVLSSTMYECAVHLSISFACLRLFTCFCYSVSPCNRCNKEHFELELELLNLNLIHFSFFCRPKMVFRALSPINEKFL